MERKITIEESVPYTEDYQNKMLEENQVEGLLEMHGRGMDDKSCYDYDVSGKVSMKALYEKHTMSGEEIKILLKSILRVVKEVERYLLNVNCILMDPEYIFYTEEKYYFCYYPPKEKSLWEGFHHLSEYLVKCADYQDKECVQIVFLLHKETMKENYSLEQIIKECVKEEEENVLAEDKNTDLGAEEEKEGNTYFDRTEHDWIASQEMGSTILRETENLWTPMKRFLHRRRKPKWGDWDGLYIEEEDLQSYTELTGMMPDKIPAGISSPRFFNSSASMVTCGTSSRYFFNVSTCENISRGVPSITTCP